MTEVIPACVPTECCARLYFSSASWLRALSHQQRAAELSAAVTGGRGPAPALTGQSEVDAEIMAFYEGKRQ